MAVVEEHDIQLVAVIEMAQPHLALSSVSTNPDALLPQRVLVYANELLVKPHLAKLN